MGCVRIEVGTGFWGLLRGTSEDQELGMSQEGRPWDQMYKFGGIV